MADERPRNNNGKYNYNAKRNVVLARYILYKSVFLVCRLSQSQNVSPRDRDITLQSDNWKRFRVEI